MEGEDMMEMGQVKEFHLGEMYPRSGSRCRHTLNNSGGLKCFWGKLMGRNYSVFLSFL